MKKIKFYDFYFAILGMALISFAFLFFLIIQINKAQKAHKEITNCVGKEVVIQNDTLLILHYNSWKDVFVLSNGIEIDQEYAKHLVLVK